MSNRTTIQLYDLLANLVMPEFGKQVNPNIIIDATSGEDSEAYRTVGSVPEADVSSVSASRRWIPWHDQEIYIRGDGEADCN